MKKLSIILMTIMLCGFHSMAQHRNIFRCKIQNAENGRVVDADMAGGNNYGTNGTEVHLFSQNGQNNQEWIAKEVEQGVYTFESFNHKVLEHDGGSMHGNGTRMQIWDWLNGNNQKWRVRQVAPGIYSIQSLSGEWMLDATGPTFNREGGNLQLWQPLNNINQKWRIIPVL